MSLKTRKEIVQAKIGSLLLYGSPLYCGQTQEIRNNLTTQLMKLNRLIFNQNTYKMSNKRICKNIQVELPDQLIKKNTLNMIHKLVVKRETDSIAKRIRIMLGI